MSHYYKPGVSEYPPRIVCHVCGLEGPADYPLYMSPHGFTGHKSPPFFPFLKELEPPVGCRAPDNRESAVFSCRQCYSALMKQWDDNELGGVPTERRVYWTKRCAGLSILDPDQQLAVNTRECARHPPSLSQPHPLARPRASTSGFSDRVIVSPSVGLKEMGPPTATSIVAVTDQSQDTDADSALDLSSGSRTRDTLKSCSSAMSHISAVSHHSSYMSEGAGSSTDILDLTLPDKNATTEVCYVCGDEFKKGILAFIHTRPVSRSPHFPSLVAHSRPPRSRPMDSAGRVQCCDECNTHLVRQWDKFEEEKLAHVDRNYILRKRQTPVVDTTTFVCYICALDYNSASLRLLYCRANSENEPYYPQVEQQRPPPGASPISSGGMVQVCSHCYKCTREKYTGYVNSHSDPQPPLKKRKSSRAASVPEIIAEVDHADDDGKISPADVECPLCRRKYTVLSFKFLHSQGPPLGGLPYFPFLRNLPRLNDEQGLLCDEDSQGRVRACQACHNSLINQWTAYQRESAPIDERTYSYMSIQGHMSSGRLTPGNRATATPTSGRSLHSPGAPSVTSGPATASKYPASENVRPRSNSNTVVQLDSSQVSVTKHGAAERLEPRPRSNSNPHSPRVPALTTGQPPTCHSPISVHSATSADPAHKPNPSSFYCFLCGLHSELSFARMLYSEAQGKKAPFFPFMKDHSPKPRAEVLRDDGTALVCTFCYHTVMEQWQRYQDERNPVSPSSRKYNVNDYVCFVCHVKTYRKRIRALRVMDFPFFRQHKQTKGTITMENGDMAAVCLDCFENLKNQFMEAAKYGIPLDKRQYNWMQVPPPPEDAVQLITPQERLDRHISVAGGSESENGSKIQHIGIHSKLKDSAERSKQGASSRPPAGVHPSHHPASVVTSAVSRPGPVSGHQPPVAPGDNMRLVSPVKVTPASTAFRPVVSHAAPGLVSHVPVFSHHVSPGVTNYSHVSHVGLPALPLALPSPCLPSLLAYQPPPQCRLPPHLPISHPFSLESDPVYRAQLERLAAASLSSSLPQAGLMSPFSLLPRPPGHLVTSLPPRSSEAGQPGKSHKQPQSGNANAPPSLVLGREGPVSSVSNNLVMCATAKPVFHCTLVLDLMDRAGLVTIIVCHKLLLPDNRAILNIININVLLI